MQRGFLILMDWMSTQFKFLMRSDEKDVSARWLMGIPDREGDEV